MQAAHEQQAEAEEMQAAHEQQAEAGKMQAAHEQQAEAEEMQAAHEQQAEAEEMQAAHEQQAEAGKTQAAHEQQAEAGKTQAAHEQQAEAEAGMGSQRSTMLINQQLRSSGSSLPANKGWMLAKLLVGELKIPVIRSAIQTKTRRKGGIEGEARQTCAVLPSQLQPERQAEFYCLAWARQTVPLCTLSRDCTLTIEHNTVSTWGHGQERNMDRERESQPQDTLRTSTDDWGSFEIVLKDRRARLGMWY
jgi:hypothetical protein